MEDFVRVGVADARVQTRVGERALQGVILDEQMLEETIDVRFEDLESTSIEIGDVF